MKNNRRSPPRKKLFFSILKAFVLMLLGALIPYFTVRLLPGPKLKADVMFADRDPLGPICPSYFVLLSTRPGETIDYVHFEIQFPEEIGANGTISQTFSDAPPFDKVAPGTPMVMPLSLDRYCNLTKPPEPLPSSIDVRLYTESRLSKLVVSAGDFSNGIMGIYTVPRMFDNDPISKVHCEAEYRYTKWGYSLRKKFEFSVRDARGAQWHPETQ